MAYHPTTEEFDQLIEAFDQIKAEKDSLLRNNTADAFTLTSVYHDALREGKCLVVGRKGSGKSAMIFGHIERSKEVYSVVREIEADELPFPAIYHFYYKEIRTKCNDLHSRLTSLGAPHTNSDLLNFVNPVRLSAYAWQQAITKSASFFAAQEWLNNESISAEDHRILAAMVKDIRNEIGPDSSIEPNAVLFGHLVRAYGYISDVLESLIKEFVGFWPALITKIANKLIGMLKEDTSAPQRDGIEVLTRLFKQTGKRMFLTYDRFDDFYDKHYSDSLGGTSENHETVTERRQLLAVLLEGLVLASSATKNDKNFVWIDLLVTIPMDKFLELRLRERARIEQTNLVYLQWTPVELYDYVNRRIRFVLKDKIPPDTDPWKFLFPDPISHTLVGGAKEDSFLYIVRHTLQKPREIQKYISALFMQLRSGYRGEDLTSVFRAVVQRESREIIRTELKEEFTTEYRGLRDIFRKIEVRRIETHTDGNIKKSAVLAYEDFCSLIKGVNLSPDLSNVADITLRLFHIGMIGIRKLKPNKQEGFFEHTVTQNKQEVSYCYFYNSDDGEPFHSDVIVVFHPMFFDELGIVAPKEYIINELRWDMFTNGRVK